MNDVTIAAYVPGMMDRSRFTASLMAPVGPVMFVSDPAAVASNGVSVLVIDLDRCDDVESFLAEGVISVGFGSHVENETLTAAADAGVDQVMARSAFFRRLPELIAELVARADEATS